MSAEDGTINKPVKSWRSQRFSLELYFYPVFLLRVQSECSSILITCGSEVFMIHTCLNLLTRVLIILIKDGVRCVCFDVSCQPRVLFHIIYLCKYLFEIFTVVIIFFFFCIICAWSLCRLLAVTEGETLSLTPLSVFHPPTPTPQGKPVLI